MTAERAPPGAGPPSVLESLFGYVQSGSCEQAQPRDEPGAGLAERMASGAGACSSGAPLPPLRARTPAPGSLRALLQRAARRRKLLEAEAQLDEADLRRAVALLEAQAVPGPGGELRINYDGFAQVATECVGALGPHVSALFQASTFLQFERDGAGAISLPLYVQYMSQHANALQLRAQLCYYDQAGTGEFTGPQLERYLADVAQELPLLSSMEPWFLPHYTRIAARKLLFFHGRRRAARGELRARLSDLLVSPVMMELQELRALGLAGGAHEDRDLSSNWFSLQSTQRVYNTFHAWDADGSGTLSRAEFSRISQGTMSELFISRVFEEHAGAPRGGAWPPKAPAAAVGDAEDGSSRQGSPARAQRLSGSSGGSQGGEGGGSGAGSPLDLPRMGLRVRTRSDDGGVSAAGGGASGGGGSPSPGWRRGGSGKGGGAAAGRQQEAAGPRDEMDMMAFVDFVLAWDHRNHPAALGYFFPIYDLQKRGYLTHADLYTFFREIHAMWVAMGEYADLSVHDVIDEIIDMAATKQPGRVTLRDLRECKVAGTIFSMLANVDQFWQYNYRENNMQGPEGGDNGGSGGGGEQAAPA